MMGKLEFELPEGLKLSDREDLPTFTGKFSIDALFDVKHIDTAEERIPRIRSHEVEPSAIIPDKADLASKASLLGAASKR